MEPALALASHWRVALQRFSVLQEKRHGSAMKLALSSAAVAVDCGGGRQ